MKVTRREAIVASLAALVSTERGTPSAASSPPVNQVALDVSYLLDAGVSEDAIRAAFAEASIPWPEHIPGYSS